VSQQLIFDLKVENKQAVDSINAFFDIYQKGVDGMSKMMSDALGKPVEKKVTIALEGDKMIAKEVEVVSKEVKAIEVAAKAMNGEFGRTPNALKRQLTVLKAIQGDTKKYNEETGRVTGTWKRLQGVIDEVQRKIQQMGTGSNGLEKTLLNSQIAADSLMGAFNMLVGSVKNFITTGADMEVLFLQLQGFTGGVEEAADAYQRFVEIGQATPFTAKQVATAARTMMGFGIETSEAITQVERLAVVAAATGGELTHMARNLGQIQANQRAYTRDLMQFANQGIPIYQEIANVLDVTTGQVRKMAEEGQIGYTEVAVALRNMTAEGTAFANIAEEMDATFSAKMEAIGSAVETVAGQFLAMVTKVDQSFGGLISGALQLFIDFLNDIGTLFGEVAASADELRPVIAGLSAAFATLVALTVAQNWTAVVAGFNAVMAATKLQTIATWAAATAQATLNALFGNWVSIAAAGAAAATITAVAMQNGADAANEEAEGTRNVHEAIDDSIESREAAAFATDELNHSLKEFVKTQQEEYEGYRQNQDLAKKKAQSAIEWQEAELAALKASQKERRDEIKRGIDEEKALHKDLSAQYKLAHKERMTEIDEKYRKIFDSIDAELGLLDEKSAAERELEALERSKLEAKLATLKVGSEEWLQTKVRLEQMDKALKREELMAKKKEETKNKEKEKKEAEADYSEVTKAEQARHEQVMSDYDAEIKKLDERYIDEKANLQLMKDTYAAFFRDVESKRFEDHEAALQYMNEQLQAWNDYEKKAMAVLEKVAAKKREVLSTKTQGYGIRDVEVGGSLGSLARASGGPVTGGTKYTVNELGREAFLSASGRLSMINAPAWGQWRAPSSGTVIPAHLTSQLDIPAGGININSMPSTGRSGRVKGAVTRAGDSIQNNVTIQAVNPNQAANNVMTQLAKFRHVRYH